MKDSKNKLLEAIKGGLKGEMDSVTTYKDAASKTDNEEVKQFFSERIKEEKMHYNMLIDFYKAIESDSDISELGKEIKNMSPDKNKIFSDDFKRRIGENQAVFSAMSVAALLEKESMDYYEKCAQETDEPTLKDFFQTMKIWEEVHYEDVLDIQKEAEKHYWRINNFEPF